MGSRRNRFAPLRFAADNVFPLALIAFGIGWLVSRSQDRPALVKRPAPRQPSEGGSRSLDERASSDAEADFDAEGGAMYRSSSNGKSRQW